MHKLYPLTGKASNCSAADDLAPLRADYVLGSLIFEQQQISKYDAKNYFPIF